MAQELVVALAFNAAPGPRDAALTQPCMELTQLLSPERILCRCQVQSKKRVLQTLAELLSDSLCPPEPLGDHPEGQGQPPNRSIENLTNRFKLSRHRAAESEDNASLSDMRIMDAFNSRERLGSTGIGNGVALPHSRLPGVITPVAALVTLENGVDYQTIDNTPVDLIIGLLVPEQCHDEHLEVLRKIAIHFSDSQFREHLRRATDASQLYDYLLSVDPAA